MSIERAWSRASFWRLCLVCLAMVSQIGVAHAQQAPQTQIKEPTPAQLEMNGEAINAVNAKEYGKAIDLFKASLALGELNITYLNMGRTYQRMGECAQAKRIYRKARETSFKVASPTPEEVNQALNEYETSLYAECLNGELTVTCEPGKLDLYVNTRGPLQCPSASEPLKLKEGEYVLKGVSEGYETREITVKVTRVDPTIVALTLARKVEQPDPTPTADGSQSQEKLDEINARLKMEADERAARERAIAEQNRRDEEARERDLAEKRRIEEELAYRAKQDNQSKYNRDIQDFRTKRWTQVVGGALFIGGLAWDTCIGFGGLSERAKRYGNKPYDGSSWCAHTYDGEGEIIDVAPLAIMVAGALLATVPTRIINKRRERDEIEQLVPSEIEEEK